MSASAEPAAAQVTLAQFTLRAGPHTLLDRVQVEFPAGEITLIVGASGVGKTLLLKTLVGLIHTEGEEVRAEGKVQIGERDVLADGPGVGLVGVVFQNFALLDELSPLDNLRFAAAHRSRTLPAAPANTPERLLEELGVPRHVRTSALSGGQSQRLAIARTLAYDPAVILFDEPTSGLDGGTARKVAQLIRDTHAQHAKTTIIVTHDVQVLAPIADRIFLLDPTTRSLRPIAREEVLQPDVVLPRMKQEPQNDDTANAKSTRGEGSKTILSSFLIGTSQVIEQAAIIPWRLVPRWHSPRWGARFLLHYLRLVAGPSAWIYVAVAGAIAGFVATDYTFRFLPYRSYVEPLVVENLVEALGFALFRILVPILICSMIAARCGAAVASDIGAKVYGRQFDALRSLGAAPERYLATNVLWAFLVGTLVLNLIAFLAARFVSVIVFAHSHPELGPFFWQSHFDTYLRIPGELWYRGAGWWVLKLLVCGAGLAQLSYGFGAQAKHSPADVSAGITRTVLWSTLYVLVVQMLFALVEYDQHTP